MKRITDSAARTSVGALAASQSTPANELLALEAVQKLVTEPVQLLALSAGDDGSVSVKWRYNNPSRPNSPSYPEVFTNLKGAEDLAARLDARFNEVYPQFQAQEASNKVWENAIHGMGYSAEAKGSVLSVSKEGKPVREVNVGFPIDSMVPLIHLTDQLRLRRGVGGLGEDTRLPPCALVAGVAAGANGVKECRVALVNLESGELVATKGFTPISSLQAQKVIPPPPPLQKPPEPQAPVEPSPPRASSLDERSRFQREQKAYQAALKEYRQAHSAYLASPEHKAWEKDRFARVYEPPRPKAEPGSPPEVISLAPGRVEIQVKDPAVNLDGHLRPFGGGSIADLTMALEYTVIPDPADLAGKTQELRDRLGADHVQFEVVSSGGGRTIFGSRTPPAAVVGSRSGNLLDYRLPMIAI